MNAVAQRAGRRFDKGGENFYDQISALHKSVRGSDPDASLYWLVRMLDGGVDPRYLARRMIRMASEDIGLADPRALEVAINAAEVYERLGTPEGELALAECVIYLAVAAKSQRGLHGLQRGARVHRRGRHAARAAAHPQRADQAHEEPGLRQGLPLRARRGRGLRRGRELLPRRHGAPTRGTSPPTAAWKRRSARSSSTCASATRRRGRRNRNKPRRARVGNRVPAPGPHPITEIP